MRTTITEALVRGARPGFIRDDRVIGFALRTTASGFKSFIVEARVSGRVRRFTISPADRATVAEARAQARQVLAGMVRGRDPAVVKRAKRERSRTLDEMLDEYISARQVKASTASRYRGALRRACGDWLAKPIVEIIPAQVRVRYEEIAKRSISEANNFARTLRAVSRRAAVVLPDRADGSAAMKAIPTASLQGAWRTLDRRTNVLEPSEIAPWLKGVEGLHSNRSKRALLTLLLTGLRAQEALQLDWHDVDEDRRRLIIADSKTGGFVKVIGPRLAAWLTTWRDGRVKGPLFNVNDLRAALDQVEKAGGKAITPHDLRRTFASFAERAGAPITTLKVLMNHSTRGDITMGYVRTSEADLQHWAGVIESAILRAAESGAVVPLDRVAHRDGARVGPEAARGGGYSASNNGGARVSSDNALFRSNTF
jgi:integrase